MVTSDLTSDAFTPSTLKERQRRLAIVLEAQKKWRNPFIALVELKGKMRLVLWTRVGERVYWEGTTLEEAERAMGLRK